MGRADLASHRSSSPSDTKPICFPKRANWVLQDILRIPNINIATTITTFRNATTQKAQVSAIKLLGIQLRDAHTVENSSGQPLCACVAKSELCSHDIFFCRMIGSIITGVLFDSPDATAGLVATALRAFLRCPIRLDEVHDTFSQFFKRLELVTSSLPSSDPCVRFSALVTDMCLISVTVAEPQTRPWIFDHAKRVLGSLHTINDVVQIYLYATMRDEIETMQLLSDEDQLKSSHGTQCEVDSKKLLENAADFGLKAAQDLLNGLRTSVFRSGKVTSTMPTDALPIVKNLVASCRQLLLLSTIPRNCALACSIAYITGLLIVEGAEDNLEEVSQLLREKVFAALPHFPHFSRLSLLRAMMETPAARVAQPSILFPLEDRIWTTSDNSTIFERLIRMIEENEDSHLRYLAMDALVKCIRRRIPLKLGIQCRTAAVLVIKSRWNETFPGTTLQIKEAVEALIAVDGNDIESSTFWEEMAFALVKGSWYHRGMYAPLSILINRVGPMRLLRCEPKCQERALEAACADSGLTKAAADWLGAFWNALRTECRGSHDSFTDMTCPPLLLALTSPSQKSVREKTAEHILPVYFRRLDKKLVELYAKSLLDRLDKLEIDELCRAGAVVTIMSVARNHGVCVGSFTESDVLHLLRGALMSADEEMRSTTFELIVTSRAPTEPIKQEELDLVLMYLPIALTYCSSLSHRSRFRHSMRRFFERFAACRKAASDGCGGWWTRERKLGHGGRRTASFEDMRELLVERLVRFETACFKILLANVYPGAVFGRRMNAFELLTLMSKNLGLKDFISSSDLYGPVLACISAGLLDEWEKTRRSALNLLLSLPEYPCGLQTLSDAAAMQEAAVPLLQSPKLRDVDSGASIIRFLFKKLVFPMVSSEREPRASSEVKYFSFPDGLKPNPQPQFDVPKLFYARTILVSLEKVLNHSNTNFSKACASGLFHGGFRILHHVLKDCAWNELASGESITEASLFLSDVINLAWSCALIALKGVSFEALTSFSGLPINGEAFEEEHIFLHEEKQLEMTACFLSLKEICITLGIMIYEISDFDGVSWASGEQALLRRKYVRRIGDLFLHVFTNTRHWGVIDGAAEGFQLVCERLLLARTSALRSMPKVWSLQMINDALEGNMYVLRRSAGLPALVNAVVNSEANSNCRSLHAPLLDGIVTILLEHLENSHMFVDARTIASERSKKEEGVSHALNLLRSLFLNSKIAKRILKYYEKTVIHCVEAFCSASWLIRNSAMMLFSALIRRGIGVKTEPESLQSYSFAKAGSPVTLLEARRMQGVTPVQFFSRYPKLHPFLNTQLHLSVRHAENGKETDYPSLFPTLYLLSSLSPGAPEDPATVVSMKPFREILRKCAHWRSDYIRRVAASASVLLIDDHLSAIQFLRELITTAIPFIPSGFVACTENFACDEERGNINSHERNERERVLRQNHLHGDLLTVEAILKQTSRVLNTQYMKDVVQMFAQNIPMRIWIAYNQNPCRYTRAVMVRIMCIVYRMACHLIDNSEASEYSDICQSVISLCHKLDDALRREESCSEPKESLIGIPTLRKAALEMSRTRFSRVALNSEQYPHVPSLQVALFAIETDDLEQKVNGFENFHCTLSNHNHGISAMVQKQGNCMSGEEAAHLCLRIWSHAKYYSKTAEDEKLLISALKAQSTFFDTSRQHWGSGLQEHVWTEEELIRVMEHSRYHTCGIVREEALVLLGRAASLNPNWMQLTSFWMDGLETAVTSSDYASRLAVCTSLTASGIRYPQKCADIPGELVSRAYILWVKLLQDDHADVVSHALTTVQTYLWGTQRVTTNVLPTLKEIFKRLAEHHGTSTALFHFAKLLLGEASDTKRRSSKLFQFLAKLTDQERNSAKVFEHRGQKGFDPEKAQKTRLFELEEGSVAGEKVLGMQLIASCYESIISNVQINNQEVRKKVETLVKELLRELRTALELAARPIGAGICGSDSYDSLGFETSYACTLRSFLGIRCTQVVSESNEPAFLKNLIIELRADTQRLKHSLHPVLVMAVNGLCMFVDGERGPWGADSINQILFLL
eukprot:TRINITY_DN190_c0_g2_i1.p1 TRINITY_DN190_c0_g2~~TRINITY_DN190_c0_g2_i1.p1  ORF type:complete len:2049 (-),score=196.00 TRINITY_DN190_c0_g2_i1:6382-12528(-)